MSRIGKKPVKIPEGVTVTLDGKKVDVEGKLGKLSEELPPLLSAEFDEEAKILTILAADEDRQTKALHGLFRALIQNMVVGVTEGFLKKLELQGTGYIAAIQNNELQLRVGFANEIHKPIPEGLEVTCPDQQHVHVKGIHKQQVGQFAAEVRAVRKAEPYLGKGIRYEDEVIRRKEGKAAVK
jgi:large subunit ribosomal protein L6